MLLPARDHDGLAVHRYDQVTEQPDVERTRHLNVHPLNLRADCAR